MCQPVLGSWVLSSYRLQGTRGFPVRGGPDFANVHFAHILRGPDLSRLVADPSANGCRPLASYFSAPDDGLRPIFNLKGFNGSLKCLPFRMLHLSCLLSSIRHGDWFTMMDLRNTYFHIPIHRAHRKSVVDEVHRPRT